MLAEGKRVLEVEARAILALIPRLGEAFCRAVDLLGACRSRVVVTGMGKSGIIAKKIAATLASTGTPALFLHPAEGVHGDLGMVTRGDIVLAISNSGETEEICRILPALKRLSIPLVALTGNPVSTLARAGDVVLDVSVKEEACPLNLVPTASTTATLALGDALAVALLGKRGFQEADFASFHPGGTLGRRLLIRVADLLHTGEALPVVRLESPMKEVLLVITSKKLGMTCVVDAGGRIQGIITDGDLRRNLEIDGDFLTRPAAQVMTRHPKTIAAEALAFEALAVMERHSITALIVPDEEGRPAGVIHIHDIMRAGVV
jgi:arabinose-5-phosphate isomerase